MASRSALVSAARGLRQLRRPRAMFECRRAIQISATPTSETPILTGDVLSGSTDSAGKKLPLWLYFCILTSRLLADARFEVLGAPYSLLSVSLSASQKLYTRRGTLVGVSGKTENVR